MAFRRVLFFLLLVVVCGCQQPLDVDENNSPWCQERRLNHQYIAHWKSGKISLVHSKHIRQWLKQFATQLNHVEPNYAVPTPQVLDSDQKWSSAQLRQAIGMENLGEDSATPGAPILVAVVDSGVDVKSPYIFDKIYQNPQEQNPTGIAGVDDDANGYIDDISGWNFAENSPQQHDEIGHGTSIAGLITGHREYSKNVAIAPNAQILPVDFMTKDGGTEYHAYLAVTYAVENHAKIVNNSWAMECSSLMNRTFQLWAKKDVLFVNAAGNMRINAFLAKIIPASLQLLNFINVGSTNQIGLRSAFSNFGPSIHIYAPGENIPIIGGPNPETGTSLSAGLVSGAAAYVWGQFPNASATQIREILLPQHQSATRTPRISVHRSMAEGHKRNYHLLPPTGGPSSPP